MSNENENEYVFLHDNPLHRNISDSIGDKQSAEIKIHLAIFSLSPEHPFRLPNPTPGKINTYTHEPKMPCLKYLVTKRDNSPSSYEFPSFTFQISTDDTDSDKIDNRFREECYLALFDFLQLNLCSQTTPATALPEPTPTPATALTEPTPTPATALPEPTPTPATALTEPTPTPATALPEPTPTPATALPEPTPTPATATEKNASTTQTGGDEQSTAECDTKSAMEKLFQTYSESMESIYRGYVELPDKTNVTVLFDFDKLFSMVDMNTSKYRESISLEKDEQDNNSQTPTYFFKPNLPNMYPICDDNISNKNIRWAIVHELVQKQNILGVPVDPLIKQAFDTNKSAFQIHYMYLDKLDTKSLEDIISMGINVSPETLEMSKKGEGEIYTRRDRIVDFPYCVYLMVDETKNEMVPSTEADSDKRIMSANIPSKLDEYKYAEEYGDRYCVSLRPISDDPAVVLNTKRYAFLEYEEKYLDEYMENDGLPTPSPVSTTNNNNNNNKSPTMVGGSDETNSNEESNAHSLDEEKEFQNLSVATIYFRQKIEEKEIPVWGVLTQGHMVPL